MNTSPRRVNFVSIQNSHTVACDGYHPLQIRTGFDSVIADRTSGTYACTAKKKGVVSSVTPTGIIVTYDSGEKIGAELGRIYGNAAGLTIPHEVVTNLRKGDIVNVGDCIAYNSGFFEPDPINPKRVLFKMAVTIKTALVETSDTLLDSSTISPKAAKKLATGMTKVKSVVVNFRQNMHRVAQVGTVLSADDILCIVEDEMTASTNLFDNESLETLKMLGAQAPQAKMAGKLERVEVFYHGEKEDMSATLRALADASDKLLAAKLKSVGKSILSGSVTDNYRVDGDPLALDTMVVKFYITANVNSGVGDKVVFSNQLKSVTGSIMSDDIKAEDGTEIEAFFGSKAVFDRIVNSPFLIGTSTTLLNIVAKKAVEAYRGK